MSLRVALLAHSTNPRGGVVHALELGNALVRLGHDAVVHAPDRKGTGFFRQTICKTVSVPASPAHLAGEHGAGEHGAGVPLRSDTHAMITGRVTDYLGYFEHAAHRRFDAFHAQDGISANALATLKQRGLIGGFARTVHHIDVFEDPCIAALQKRAIVEADAHFVVSAMWQSHLKSAYGIEATVVGNGVDLDRFSLHPQPEDIILRQRLGLQSGPVYLCIGGVEERKNTLRILEAFAQIHGIRPSAQLVIAGGSSLLAHDAYQARFTSALAASDLPAHAVVRLGAIADSDMPALYRNSDALIFPSVKEGFGLVVLEAMASGVPVVTAMIEPFISYLGDHDVIWCTPDQVGSIADAMMLVLFPQLRRTLSSRGRAVALRHDWSAVAQAHVRTYQNLESLQHA